MGALIKILPWIAIYAFIGVVVGCAMFTWSKDDDKETLSMIGGVIWPVMIVYVLVSELCTKVFLPYFKWLKSGRPYFSGEIGKSCVQCKSFTYVEDHSAVEAKCRYDDRYIKARNCTCDKFRRNRFWRYKVKR